MSREAARTLERAWTAEADEFRRLVDVLAEAVLVHGGGRVLFANPAAAKLVGAHDPRELLGKPILDFVHPDSRPGAIERIGRGSQGKGASDALEERFLRLDGQPFDVEVQSIPTSFRGEPAGLIVVRDVTERKRVEQELRKSDARLRALTDAIPEAFWMWEPSEADPWYVSPAGEKLFGHPPEDFRKNPQLPLECIHPDDRARVLPILLGRFRDGYDAEYRIVRGDGEVRWMRSRAFPSFDESGELVRVTGVTEDVSERHASQEVLRRSEASLAEAQRIARLGHWEVEIPDGDPFAAAEQRWSDEVFRIAGFEPDETAPSLESFLELAHPDDRERVRQALTDALRHRKPYHLEHRIVHRDGTERHVESEARIHCDERTGEPVRVVGTVQDVTERRLAEEKLRQSEKQYRLLFESNPQPMWVYDPDTLAFVAVNEAAMWKYGYSLDEFLSMTIKDIRPLEDVPALLDRVAELDSTPGVTSVWRHRTKTGDLIDVEVASHAIVFAGKRRRLVLSKDVTAERRAQTALREYAAALAQAQSIAHIGSFSVDLGSGAVAWSDEAARILGLAPGDPPPRLDEIIARMIHPDDRGAMIETIELAARSPRPRQLEFRIIRPDGTTRVVIARGRRADAGAAPSVRLVGTVQDVTEQERAKRALAASEKKFRGLFDASLDAITLNAQADGRYLDVNPEFMKLCGFTREDVIGRTPRDLGIWVDKNLFKRVLAGLERDGFVRDCEAEMRTKDGRVLWALFSAKLIDFGGVRCVVSFSREITQLKDAQRALRESEDRYRGLVESSPDGIVVHCGGKIVFANASAIRIAGAADAAGVLGRNLIDFVLPEFADAVRARLDCAGTEPAANPPTAERIRRLDGRTIDVEIVSTPIFYNGAPAVQVLLRDITERVRAAREAEERARMAQFAARIGAALTEVEDPRSMLRRCAEIMVERLDVAFAGVWKVAETGEVLELEASSCVADVVGAPAERVRVGERGIGAIAAERRAHFTDAVVGDPRVGDQSWARREAMVGFAGLPLLVEDRLVGAMAVFARAPLSALVRDTLGSIATSVALAMENRRTATELRSALGRAEAADRLKTSFLANMSHEIRTPLNVILGMTGFVADHLAEQGDHSQDETIDAVNRAGRRLLTTIQGILDLSKIETRGFDLRPDRIELAPYVQSRVRELEPLARAKGLRLAAAVEAEDAAIVCDEYCLSQALGNLVDNAVKFTPHGADMVALRSDPSGGVVLEVADTGIGIDERFMPLLFQPFSQEDSGYGRRFEGSGLGLALVKRYVEMNGGRVTVQSERGRGSAFRLHFPPAAVSAGGESAVTPASGD